MRDKRTPGAYRNRRSIGCTHPPVPAVSLLSLFITWYALVPPVLFLLLAWLLYHKEPHWLAFAGRAWIGVGLWFLVQYILRAPRRTSRPSSTCRTDCASSALPMDALLRFNLNVWTVVLVAVVLTPLATLSAATWPRRKG